MALVKLIRLNLKYAKNVTVNAMVHICFSETASLEQVKRERNETSTPGDWKDFMNVKGTQVGNAANFSLSMVAFSQLLYIKI